MRDMPAYGRKDRYDAQVTLTVPVSCAGMEDEIDIKTRIELVVDPDNEEAWIENVWNEESGEHASALDAHFAEAEAWLDRNYETVLRGEL